VVWGSRYVPDIESFEVCCSWDVIGVQGLAGGVVKFRGLFEEPQGLAKRNVVQHVCTTDVKTSKRRYNSGI